MSHWYIDGRWPDGQAVDIDSENSMFRAHLLWDLATLLQRLADRTARRYTARHDRDYGGHTWTGH